MGSAAPWHVGSSWMIDPMSVALAGGSFTTEPPRKFCVQLLVTPWTTPHRSFLSFTIYWCLLKFMSTESVIPSNYLILCHPSPLALNLSKHQGLFQSVSSLHQVAKVLEFQLQHQSFQWTPRTDKGWTGWISLQSKGLSRVSPTPQFRSIYSSVFSFLYV